MRLSAGQDYMTSLSEYNLQVLGRLYSRLHACFSMHDSFALPVYVIQNHHGTTIDPFYFLNAHFWSHCQWILFHRFFFFFLNFVIFKQNIIFFTLSGSNFPVMLTSSWPDCLFDHVNQ